VKQLDRFLAVLLLESILRIFVVGSGKDRRRIEGSNSKSREQDRAGATQNETPRDRKILERRRRFISQSRRTHSVCRKSTIASISCSVKMRFRPNGGIAVSGFRRVSSVRIATSSLRSGYLRLMSLSSGPIVPGSSPPLIW